MKITATFIDEISGDIPHQNWGVAEWAKDFRAMKHIGINTVIMIRCGNLRFSAYPSPVLEKYEQCYRPPVDLIQMFLDLSQENGMKFFCGNFNGGYHVRGDYRREIELNQRVGEEIQQRYGNHPAFAGWYLTQEVGRLQWNIIEVFSELGRFYKSLSGGMPTMISPYIEGVKLYDPFGTGVNRDKCVKLETHTAEWSEIMSAVRGAIDVIAFQDGGCDYCELKDFLQVSREIADRNQIDCWTNCECFDRDMPIRFLPIKWEKLLLKLRAAEAAGIRNATAFEFSHFMSPNSCYLQAHGLYKLYCEHFNIG